MSKKIGIIGAMSVELEFLKSKLEENSAETKAGGMTFTEGKINGSSVVLVQSGVGKVNAALCAQRLILQFGCTHIINTGIAGAMAFGLKVLDFVASTDAVYHDMDATGFGYKKTEIPQMKCSDFPADGKMLEAARSAFKEFPAEHKLVFGRIATGDQFVSDKEKKSAIQETCSPACVEMEGAAVAHACWINEIPFVIIRCMSDMADDDGESTYSFNENEAASLSGSLVLSMLGRF
ncbi:5'-methylthioadenosine/adenosylhomocysteine nucleosidase [uncultured Treponema sp.]|uniref:5'-methylthioadenosine/adenosylhomocysteine nucleosidase n=1 Tax=uncultured Treponema sp. TaxID=162155 RepID=UPI000E80EA45|nr:5'-methylthioadenosine/adenosylhomocysteine nucleosidase [uncultured Treponema sp.]HAZ96827.1 5'-methylthioadenosine/adenosylhomocysteine nucleosidase [Treponema sp.]